MGPLAFSSNAEPTYNFRFVSTRPHPLPFVPSWGTYRFDIVLGKLSGHYLSGTSLVQRPEDLLQLRRQPRDRLYPLVGLLGRRASHHASQLQGQHLQLQLDWKLRRKWRRPLWRPQRSRRPQEQLRLPLQTAVSTRSSLRSMPMLTPTTILTPSLHHAAPSGTRESISLVFPGCRIWISAWKQSAHTGLPSGFRRTVLLHEQSVSRQQYQQRIFAGQCHRPRRSRYRRPLWLLVLRRTRVEAGIGRTRSVLAFYLVAEQSPTASSILLRDQPPLDRTDLYTVRAIPDPVLHARDHSTIPADGFRSPGIPELSLKSEHHSIIGLIGK